MSVIDVQQPAAATPVRVERRLLWAATVPGIVLSLFIIRAASWVFEGTLRHTLFDDAMISMTYARTLADTGELVWYPGAPRVEGITNPLWTFVMALVHQLGLSGSSASLVMMLISVVCVASAAVIAGEIASRIAPSARWAGPMTALLVGLCYPLQFWAVRGMEVGLLALLALGAILAALHVRDAAAVGSARGPLTWMSVLIALGISTRIDFALIAVVLVAWLAFVMPRDVRMRVVVAPALTILGALLIQTMARYLYFDAFVPNTYTLKVTGVPLGERLGRGIVTVVKVLPAIVLAGVALIYAWRRVALGGRQVLALLLVITGGVAAYSIYVGGDAWEFMPNRYLVPALLTLAVVVGAAFGVWLTDEQRRISPWAVAAVVGSAVALGMTRINMRLDFTTHWHDTKAVVGAAAMGLCALGLVWAGRRRTKAAIAVTTVATVAAVFLASSAIGWWEWTQRGLFGITGDQRYTELGTYINRATTPDATFAVTWAGQPAYYSERPALDFLGKSDRFIAEEPPKRFFYPGHNKWDFEYTFSLEPDVAMPTKYAETALDQKDGPDYRDYCMQTTRGKLRVLVNVDSPEWLGTPEITRCTVS